LKQVYLRKRKQSLNYILTINMLFFRFFMCKRRKADEDI
jgi:hypothetical protein